VHRHEHFDLWLDDDETLAALLGKPVVERTTLLRELGVDPRRHVSEGVLRLMDLHRLAWWASARRRPGSPRPHDAEIARLAGRLA
jgi:hypothetical protein